MEELIQEMETLLSFATSKFTRYAYDAIDWQGRMLGLVGPRGVGKTTLFLQRIKNAHELGDTLYFSADRALTWEPQGRRSSLTRCA